MIGVLIFAVDASLRRTLEQLSQKDPTIAIVGIANDQSSLLSLAATSHVDVVLTQEMPSAEMFADLRVLHDDAAWVLFQDPTEGRGALEALGAGASAMLPPIADLVEITATIKMVDNGLVVFPKQVLAALLGGPKISNGNLQAADDDHRRLSKREIAVLTAMTDGLSNKQIARRLGISFHTVKFHVASKPFLRPPNRNRQIARNLPYHLSQLKCMWSDSNLRDLYQKLAPGIYGNLGIIRMPSGISRAVTKVAYGVTQVPRVAWYIGHSLVLRELADTVRQREKSKARRRIHTDARVPDRKRIYADMAKLFLRDLANVEAGIYPVPADHDGSLLALVRRSRMFFDDLPNIHRRRKRYAHDEVLNDTTRGTRPRYYLQNFHYQSGGWMTENSAELYDTQVEVLFNGSANAIRRQALPQLHEVFAGRDQRKLSLMDVGCGTGRFFDSVKQVWPRLPICGIDMSEAYVKYANGHLKHWSQIRLSVGKAEALPVPDQSQDAVTSIFVFHELPPKVRRSVFRECARVLKPGGRFVLVDSLQHGDQPDYDGLLDVFPESYHEPYYRSYLDEDFGAIAESCGLAHVRDVNAFISKVMVFDKTA